MSSTLWLSSPSFVKSEVVMVGLPQLPDGPTGHAAAVRASERILGRAHASVEGLFSAANDLEAGRRQANPSPRGRMAGRETDILRSALVMTSAGLDAALGRLVNDAGRVLINRAGSGAEGRFIEYLKAEMNKPSLEQPFRDAILSPEPRSQLITAYLAAKTKASFQGTNDLKQRVRATLGLSPKSVTDASIDALDPFFTARNEIVHDMDLTNVRSSSLARHTRDRDTVASQCGAAFGVAMALISATALKIQSA